MTTEPDNVPRWDPARRGGYEVWYLTWNHAATGQGFWLRYLTEAPLAGPARGELWFARFDPRHPERTFGIHRHFEPARSAPLPFELALGDAELGHDRARGTLSGGGHDVRWDLHWTPAKHALRLLPDVMYGGGGRGDTTVLSPNPRVAMTGSLVIDGETLHFEHAVLGQSHVWGRKHAFAWTWGRCAEFDGAPDAVLEILGVRLQRRGVTLPTLAMVTLDLDGERHRLNQFRHVALARASWRTGHVAFSAQSAALKIEGELSCRVHELVAAPYVDPDGTALYCTNTEIGDAQVRVSRRAGLGWAPARTLDAAGRAHFETGGRSRDPAVVHDHVLV
ncbi:MAG TPA: tocopherol cyclase family protein [Kofleriaceae bacterium]|nr:tocopherol cyclase family protein [Kofleriaceae bacterium]